MSSIFKKKSVLKLVDRTVCVRCGFQNSLLINNVCYEHTNAENTLWVLIVSFIPN
jgi:hypothetical protein